MDLWENGYDLDGNYVDEPDRDFPEEMTLPDDFDIPNLMDRYEMEAEKLLESYDTDDDF